MAAKRAIDLGWFLQNQRTALLQNDFFNYTSGNEFTTVSATGTAALDDTGGTSNLLLTTAGTLDNYCGVKTTAQPFLPAVGNPMFVASRFKYTNQATNNASVSFGMASSSNLGITSPGDPTTSMSAILLYKRSTSTVWTLMVSNAGTKSHTDSNISAVDGTYDLRLDVNDFDSANCEVAPFVNGFQLTDINNIPIKLTLAYASLAKMNMVFLIQAGSGNAQTAYVDYVCSGQLRAGN